MFDDVLSRLSIKPVNSGVYSGRWIEQPGGEELVSLNPATEQPLARVVGGNENAFQQAVESAAEVFKRWRRVLLTFESMLIGCSFWRSSL